METKKKAAVIVMGLAVIAVASVLMGANIDATMAPKVVTMPAFAVWLWNLASWLCPGIAFAIGGFILLYIIVMWREESERRERHGGNGRL